MISGSHYKKKGQILHTGFHREIGFKGFSRGKTLRTPNQYQKTKKTQTDALQRNYSKALICTAENGTASNIRENRSPLERICKKENWMWVVEIQRFYHVRNATVQKKPMSHEACNFLFVGSSIQVQDFHLIKILYSEDDSNPSEEDFHLIINPSARF
jgi:hypothetical protein